MGFLFLYLLDFNYDLKLNQVARRQTSPPEILLEMIVILIYAELSGDFPLGDSRQPIYKSLRPFDLVS